MVVTTKLKDGRGPDGWPKVAATYIAGCGVKTEGPGVAWVVQVGWNHKANVVKAESPGVARVAASGCEPSGQRLMKWHEVAWVAQKPRLTRQMVRGPQQSWNTRTAARTQRPKPDNVMGWSVGLEVVPDRVAQ